MIKFFSSFFFILIATKSFGLETLDKKKFYLNDTSQLPIHAFIPNNFKANLIAIIGGKGLKNELGKSQNFLKRNHLTFVQEGIAFYLFPNFNNKEKASYKLRGSPKRAKRILGLVRHIKTLNNKPIFIIGFSRGSVDTGVFSLRYPSTIKGIIIASGIYNNNSEKAKNFSMEKIIGKKIKVDTLVVHHEKDECSVTQYKYAKSFFKKLKAPKKNLLNYTGGTGTGRECGPYHYHGFEGIELKVANDIIDWINQ